MTTARFDHVSVGTPDAARTVIVIGTRGTATADPDPAVTRRRDVRVVAVRVDHDALSERSAFGDRAPGHIEALDRLVATLAAEGPVSLVGVGEAGPVAVGLAAMLGDRADRLALVGVPIPAEQPLSVDAAEQVMAAVTAKTLIVNGQKDPDAAAAAAQWHRSRLLGARVEMVPRRDGATDDRLSLTAVWERVLSHTAPGTATRG